MNRKFKFTLFIACVIILIILLSNVLKPHSLSYKVKYNDNSFIVLEKHNNDNYYIEIKIEDSVFPFRIDDVSDNKIVNKVYYYKDSNYECVLPILKTKENMDFLCYYDGILYNYHDIKNSNNKLDNYIKTVVDYNLNTFEDNLLQENGIDDTSFYVSNDVGHYVYISSYKGLTYNENSIKLFQKDVYENNISTFEGNYYIVADYDNDFEFSNFYVINLKNHKQFKIKSKNPISFDSYIQGLVDGKIYLYDKDNEIQYEINIDNSTLKEISSSSKIKYYKNGKWQTINKPVTSKEVYFDYSTLNNYFTDYDKVVQTDNYYYLFKASNDSYKLYRADVNNVDIIKFILDVDTLDISFKDNYLYYTVEDKLYFYSDSTGLRTLLKNSELKFNNTIKYYIY